MEQPLPCNCGGSAFVDWWKSFQGEDQIFVRCSKCGTLGSNEPTEALSIESWNKEINNGLQKTRQKAA
jgi:hypothetical protein